VADQCKFCGAALPSPDARFCPSCGHALGADDLTIPIAAAGPRLIVQEPGQAKATVSIEGPRCGIGRDPSNQVVVQHDSVSRLHAQVELREAGYWVTDLGSMNGTSVNGRRLEPNTAVKLKDGDIIRIGDQHGNSVSITFSAELPEAAGREVIRLDHQRELAGLKSYTLGRDASNRVHLDHPSVSRRHARMDQTPTGHRLTDLGSTNGTFLNGQRLRAPSPVKDGDVIQIGPFKLVYDQDGLTRYAPDGNYRLDGLHLQTDVEIGSPLSPRRLLPGSGPTKLLLNDITLSIYPREFVALVGGSGAGKSTLLKALSGFVPAERGRVLINGDDLYANYSAYESIFGYVPQDDIIHHGLIVRDALTYTAEMRLPDATPDEVKTRVDDALAEVEMTAHQSKQVGRLSGGQRKRVSIAQELLAGPGLFFLDEPTSGLDPGLEKKMMYTLRRLADAGRTVVLITHATSNITQCTNVAFLADGRLVYFGPPQDAQAFFGTTDFADIYTRLSQPLDPNSNPPPPGWQASPGTNASAAQAWDEHFRKSTDYQKHVASRLEPSEASQQATRPVAPRTRPHVSPLRQFSVLTRRYFNLVRRDPMSLFVLLAIMPILGLFLLLMSHPNDLVGSGQPLAVDLVTAYQAQRLVFMLALAANLLGLFAAAYEIVKEDAIYRRERMVNLGILPYLFSKLAVLGGFAVVQCALVLLVLRIRVQYPTDGLFLPPVLEIYLTLVLTTLASLSLGLLISSLARNANMVVYMILLVLFVQIIFAGAIFPLDDSVKLLADLSTTHWSLQALGSIIGLASKGFYVAYEHDLAHVLKPWAILLLFTVVCTALTALIQKRKDTL
jgi:ABC-type multidrug transport system ATPase subunit/pSer/pThr/pTyr-binding forkhead associated (FHA) protein